MPSIGIEIKPKDGRHKKILKGLESRFLMSRRDMSKMHEKWRKAEEKAVAYIPERDHDALRRSLREAGKPQYTTITLPMSYAILMTAHTYWTSVFMSRSPIFQFSARHGETPSNEQAVESLVDYQVVVGGMLVPLYIWLYDVGKYGIGITGEYWDIEETAVAQIEEVEELFLGMIPTGKKVKKKVTRREVSYMGNRLFNIRPFDYFPDTRVPLWQVQKGEFVMRYVTMGWNEILRKKALRQLFNIEELKQKNQGRSFYEEPGSSIQDRPNTDSGFGDQALNDVDAQDLLEAVVELIPKHWGLGNSDFPEKWVFTCTRDFSLLVGARPFGAYHNKYPVNIMELEPEGYALFTRGVMEILEPLQHVLDWLINVHFYNVRKVLNDTIIIDPSRINMKDVYDPLPGGLWRLLPTAYGQDVRTIAHQLQVVDVTQNHLKDSQLISEMMMRVLGVNENIMGMLNQGGRKTATEVRTSSTFGVNRLKTQAEFQSAMGWTLLSQKLVQNTQQYYDMEQQFRIVGDLATVGAERQRMITPADIKGFYDFIPVDGTLPVDRYAQANLWRAILAEGVRYPQIIQQYDLGKIFAWIAQLAGLKNINQFKIQIVPDGQAVAEAAAGNLVPMQGGVAPTGSGTIEPGQIDGMGTTG